MIGKYIITIKYCVVHISFGVENLTYSQSRPFRSWLSNLGIIQKTPSLYSLALLVETEKGKEWQWEKEIIPLSFFAANLLNIVRRGNWNS